MLTRLWADDAGFVISAELILIATVLVIGLLVGLVTIRDDVVNELADVADAIAEVNQSYSFAGITGHSSSVSGSLFTDLPDFCQGIFGDQVAGNAPFCINMSIAGVSE